MSRAYSNFVMRRHFSVLHPHVDFGLGDRRAGDTRSHEPGADDAEARDTHGRGGVRDAGVLLQLVGREEDLDEFARDVGHRELPKQLRLALQTLGDSMLEAVLDRFERRERRRVVSARALEHLLARRSEHETAAQWIAVEQKTHEAARPLALGAPAARQTL